MSSPPGATGTVAAGGRGEEKAAPDDDEGLDMQAQKGDPDLESAQSALPQSQLNEVEDTTCSNLGEGMQGNLDRDFSRSLGTGTKLCTDASGAPGSDYDTKSAATYLSVAKDL